MKLLFYINLLGGGGAERVIANLSTYFADRGYDVILVTTYAMDNEYVVSKRIKRYILEEQPQVSHNRIISNVDRIRKLRKLMKREKPDVAIAFMEEPNFRLIISAIGLPIKTIVSVRNDPKKEYAGMSGRVIAKWILPFADGCVFQTNEAKAFFSRRLQNKSAIIYNAVKEDFFTTHKSDGNREVISCGRLQKQKNHLMLIEAFKEAIQEYPDAHLSIYGDGPLKTELQKYIDDNSINASVSLCGNSNDIPSELSRANVFVLSSDYEGMPNALMEAMAAGLACISTDCPCGGPRELISDGINGYLVPVNDTNRMADSLKQLLGNRELSDMLGNRAKERARDFHPEIIHKEWAQYIEKIANQ